ncbi:hypothetical protein [Haloarchaeobius sp. FL176]|uniref:hypothetical protein n=1 Tax=Haloarchaeobius sp. FL176 TaxID=2967129 RepID=UPI0021482073|nr:hypothetical protein [Haloarchaeobius sp. FL176]
MKSNRTETPHNPEDLQAADYDDASLKILKCLDRHQKSQANSVVIRRETGLPKHKVEQRIRADGILVRAGLVEKAGYDPDTNYAHPPKVIALTQYALDAIYYGFFEDDVYETGQVILDEEQFIDFQQSLSGLEARLDHLSEVVEQLNESSQKRYRDVENYTEFVYYEVAMLREVVNELGAPKEVMRKKTDECRKRADNGTSLKREFYPDVAGQSQS